MAAARSRWSGRVRALRRAPAVRASRRAGAWVRRRLLPSDRFMLLALLAAVTALGLLSQVDRDWFPVTTLAVPVLLAGLALRMPGLLVLCAATAGVLGAQARVHRAGEVTPGALLVIALVAAVVLVLARTRTRLGVQGTRGESMLVDLRDRLRAQGEVPALPSGWDADVELRAAGGHSFSGDFLVATRAQADSPVLELALVDVSGKGVDAGTRALLLSGAFGGLLGSLPASEFLPAANAWLLRQRWDEGFATAVHLRLDLDSGEYTVRSAGHPPLARWNAGRGCWECATAEGMVLGVWPDVTYEPVHGRLGSGDALMVFTDGMVELPGVDIADGIDRLLGVATRLVADDFRGGAARVVEEAGRNTGDDRAVVLLRRY